MVVVLSNGAYLPQRRLGDALSEAQRLATSINEPYLLSEMAKPEYSGTINHFKFARHGEATTRVTVQKVSSVWAYSHRDNLRQAPILIDKQENPTNCAFRVLRDSVCADAERLRPA